MKSFTLLQLSNYQNPFEPMKFVDELGILPPSPKLSASSLWVWTFFCDSVHIRSLAAALALLSPERRSLFRKHINAHTMQWWHHETTWKGWPDMLKELKLN